MIGPEGFPTAGFTAGEGGKKQDWPHAGPGSRDKLRFIIIMVFSFSIILNT